MNLKTSVLLTRVFGAGILGFCLRTALYRIGFDEKNILSATHPLHLACLGLTLLVLIDLALMIRRLKGSNHPEHNFPASPLRSIAALAAACLTAVHGYTLSRDMGNVLDAARVVLAFSSAVAMALCAIPDMPRRSIYGPLLGVISVFFALDMLCRYQDWSGNPQLPDYTFHVLACVLLTLCSYHRLAFHTGIGKRRTLLLCSLMGLYLCLLCAAGPDPRAFYLGGGCWAGACLCQAKPPVEREESSDVPA